jgi:hydroxymethylbilane synthase
LVSRLGGGCQMPIGAFAQVSGPSMSMTSIVVALDGGRVARAEARGVTSSPERLGIEVAERLLAQGADAILASAQRASVTVEGLQP